MGRILEWIANASHSCRLQGHTPAPSPSGAALGFLIGLPESGIPQALPFIPVWVPWAWRPGFPPETPSSGGGGAQSLGAHVAGWAGENKALPKDGGRQGVRALPAAPCACHACSPPTRSTRLPSPLPFQQTLAAFARGPTEEHPALGSPIS